MHLWMNCSQLSLPAFIIQWKKPTQSLCSFGLFICFICTQEKTHHKKEQGRFNNGKVTIKAMRTKASASLIAFICSLHMTPPSLLNKLTEVITAVTSTGPACVWESDHVWLRLSSLCRSESDTGALFWTRPDKSTHKLTDPSSRSQYRAPRVFNQTPKTLRPERFGAQKVLFCRIRCRRALEEVSGGLMAVRWDAVSPL